jgi:hypothetical protein
MSWLDDIKAVRAAGPALWDALASIIERDIQEFNKSANFDPDRTIKFARSLPAGLLINSPYFPSQLLVWFDIDKHSVVFMTLPAKELIETLHIRVGADKTLCLRKEDKLLSLDDASHLLLNLVLSQTTRGHAS